MSERLILDEAQIAALLAAAEDSRERALLGLMAFAGLRTSEAVSLRCGDVSFSPPTIHIRRGKGGHPRDVDIDSDLEVLLREYLEVTSGRTGEDYLFRSMNGHLTSRWAQRTVEQLGRHTVAGPITPNDLRWACVLRLHYHRGLKTFEIQDQLAVNDADLLKVLRLGSERWMPRPEPFGRIRTEIVVTRRGPGSPPKNRERDAELWQMVTVGGKTFDQAAREYSSQNGIEPHLSRDLVRMAVTRYESRLIKEAWNTGQRDVNAIAAKCHAREDRVRTVLGQLDNNSTACP